MRKNIAVMVYRLYNGGAERIAGLLSVYLSRIYNTYVFIGDNSEIVYDYGGTLVLLPREQEGKSKVQQLRELKERLHIDCVISFIEEYNFWNAQSRGKETVIFSVRTTLGRRSYGARMNANIEWLNRKADHIVAVSDGCRQDLICRYKLPSDEITTIYNFIDKDMIKSKSEESADGRVPGFKGKSKLIFHVGRLHEIKNQEKLLVQFALLSKREDVKLLLIGSGPAEASLREKVRELKLEDKVMMLPCLDNPFTYYKFADLFALTSKAEGMPNVLLESMLLGIPVVSVDCMSGPRELVSDDTDYGGKIRGYKVCERGILVEDAGTDDTGETDYFCQAMQRLLAEESLRRTVVKNALEFMEGYSNEKILNQWLSVIENTVPKKFAVEDMMIPALRDKKEVIVYGAGKVGTEVMLHLLEQRSDWEFACFAVTDKSTEKSPVEGVGLYELEELYGHRDKAVVVISVGKKYEEEVLEQVRRHGFEYAWRDVL